MDTRHHHARRGHRLGAVLLAASLSLMALGLPVSVGLAQSQGSPLATKCGNGPNLLADPSFENSPGGLYFAGSYLESPPAWLVGGNSVNVTGGPPSGWIAENGTLSVDLNGNAPGSVSQTVAVTPTQTYLLCFWLAGNIANGPTIKKMQVFWGGALVATYTFNITGKTATNMGWVLKTHGLVGSTTGTDTLSLVGVSPGAFGAAVDNVSIRHP